MLKFGGAPTLITQVVGWCIKEELYKELGARGTSYPLSEYSKVFEVC